MQVCADEPRLAHAAQTGSPGDRTRASSSGRIRAEWMAAAQSLAAGIRRARRCGASVVPATVVVCAAPATPATHSLSGASPRARTAACARTPYLGADRRAGARRHRAGRTVISGTAAAALGRRPRATRCRAHMPPAKCRGRTTTASQRLARTLRILHARPSGSWPCKAPTAIPRHIPTAPAARPPLPPAGAMCAGAMRATNA